MASENPPVKNNASGFTFYVSLVSQANGKIFQANPTLAAGDVKIAIDDGAPANLNTLPAVDADFTKRVKVVLNQAETNGDKLSIIFSDAAGDEWCDLNVTILTSAQTFDTTDTAVDNTYARLGAPVGASISADITTVDTVADNTYAIVNSGTYGNSALKTLIDTVDTVADNTYAIANNVTYGNSALKTLIDALNNLSSNDVQTAVDTILTAAQSALATMPSETSSLEDKINWLFARLTHKEVVDTLAGTTSIYKSDGTTVLGVAGISDDGNAFTRAKVEAPA